MRVYRASDLKLEREDRAYTHHLFWLDIAADGRLVTSSMDGLLRLYDKDFKLIAKGRAQPGKEPALVAFSPDGSRLVVGFHDVPAAAVFSTNDLRLQATLKPPESKGWRNLPAVGWGADGQMLLAGGERDLPERNGVLVWAKDSAGQARFIATGDERLTLVGGLPNGGFYYATEDPKVALCDAQGAPVLVLESRLLNFRGMNDRFRVARDGASVAFRGPGPSPNAMVFSLFDRTLARAAPGEPREFRVPVRRTPQIRVEGWEDSRTPTLDGRQIQLGTYERSRSIAIAPDGQSFVLGTEWALQRYDRTGKHLWQTLLPAVAWDVNVSEDGKTVIAALSDGTIRWYRLEDGVEYLALFVHANGEDWIAWTPQGYYVSSNYGDQYVGWHLNRGKDKTPDFYRAVQFERILYRPDIVEETFRSRGMPSGTSTRALSRFDISKLAAIAPPRMRVTPLNVGPGQLATGSAELQIEVEAASPPALEEFGVYLNGIPITRTKDRGLAPEERQRFRRRISVPLQSTDNDIRVEVSNGTALGLTEIYMQSGKPAAAGVTGDLYVLAIGANRFIDIPADRGADLLYAGRDAEMVAKTLREGGAGLFRNVYTKLLNDRQESKPTKQEILDSLSFITEAGPEDTVVVFLASHGFSDTAGNYYFLPRDAKAVDLDNVLLGKDSTGRAPSLLSWQEFFEVIRRTAGRRLLIVDTCEAKNMAGTFDAHSLKKRSAASLFALLVAAQGNEKSQEYPNKRHGLFTYALLEGLKGQADRDHDQRISLDEAFAFAVPMVEQLRNKQEGAQTPDLLAPAMLRTVPLTAVRP